MILKRERERERIRQKESERERERESMLEAENYGSDQSEVD